MTDNDDTLHEKLVDLERANARGDLQQMTERNDVRGAIERLHRITVQPITASRNAYEATIDGAQEVGRGASPAEAVGKLVMHYARQLGVDVEVRR